MNNNFFVVLIFAAAACQAMAQCTWRCAGADVVRGLPGAGVEIYRTNRQADAERRRTEAQLEIETRRIEAQRQSDADWAETQRRRDAEWTRVERERNAAWSRSQDRQTDAQVKIAEVNASANVYNTAAQTGRHVDSVRLNNTTLAAGARPLSEGERSYCATQREKNETVPDWCPAN